MIRYHHGKPASSSVANIVGEVEGASHEVLVVTLVAVDDQGVSLVEDDRPKYYTHRPYSQS